VIVLPLKRVNPKNYGFWRTRSQESRVHLPRYYLTGRRCRQPDRLSASRALGTGIRSSRSGTSYTAL